MRQLLALAWRALTDDDMRIGILDDGLKLFAQGLEEIQNEYGPDSPACTGGSFNKIIEKLVGVHPDAKQLVITAAQAAKKLQIVVKEEAYKYLLRISSPETKEEFKAFTDLIERIKEEGTVASCWPYIASAVADRMINEFGSIYNNSKDDAQFQGLLQAGVDVELDKLDQFQKQISESKGYDEWMREALHPKWYDEWMREALHLGPRPAKPDFESESESDSEPRSHKPKPT